MLYSRQDMIGKLSFDDRDTAFDLGAFPVESPGEMPHQPTTERMMRLPRRPIADANGVSSLQVTPNVPMIVQGVEPAVQSQALDSYPRRLSLRYGSQLSGIACRTPADILTEYEQTPFLDQNDMFDKGPMLSFAPSFRAFAQVPTTAQIMGSRVGQPVACRVAQGIASSLQGLFQLLQKGLKELVRYFSPQTPVKLLKRRMIRTVQEAQKLLKPWIRQYLLFGLSVRPFVVSSQKKQSQKLTLPIYFLREFARIIFDYFLAKPKAYQNKLLVARQLFHESSSFSQRFLSGGAFRPFWATI